MSATAKAVFSQAKASESEIIALRRQIHRYPELGFQEYRTAELISSTLHKIGLEVRTGIGRTGVVGLLDCGAQHTIAIRADMDALPIQEATHLDIASVNPGVMHACGHDAHVAMVMGAGMILNAVKEQLKINVKLIFQPCEETPPGGALEMIRDGVLQEPPVEAIFGIHVSPELPAGNIAIGEGRLMASTDNFVLTIKGSSGHGAFPHEVVDSIVIAAEVVLALQTVVSRRVNPASPVVLSIGKIQGGQKANIIADTVTIEGTVRTLDGSLRKEIPVWIDEIVRGITSSHRGSYTFDFISGRPPLVNNSRLVQLVRESASEIVGANKVFNLKTPSMVGEDFAYYLQQIPGAYLLLGSSKGVGAYPCHHPCFEVAEEALMVGAAVLAETVFRYQENIENG